MATKSLPLKNLSITELFSNNAIFEVPIYQRNYAWEKDEISALIQDIYDAYSVKKPKYYIGTLVTFNKGDQVYEVIDGQQRLTTITLVLGALKIPIKNKLTYRARKKSSDTIRSIPHFDIDEKDLGIINGFKYSQAALDEIVPKGDMAYFADYFQKSVNIIHYEVPKDIDLNHYFEVMNSRGEQLEKHEIIKARLIEKLQDADKVKFNRLWEFCSEMNVYIQQKYLDKQIFGLNHDELVIESFDQLPDNGNNVGTKKLIDFIEFQDIDDQPQDVDKIDSFQPIIDFSNFLLIVLKLCRMDESDFNPRVFNLDDKELINEFDKLGKIDEKFVKKFGFKLLKARYFLDNFLVHHANEDDTIDNNPWKLQYWHKDNDKKGGYLVNLADGDVHVQLVQLLSMFEVSFTARQRKNYLFYCLLQLFNENYEDKLSGYCDFLNGLADKYFFDVYLQANNLNEINTPLPGSFDNTILRENKVDITIKNEYPDFNAIYGDGTKASKGISLFIFNYIDYKLWQKYLVELRGEKKKEGSEERIDFFANLGCSDFGLKVFDQFYFSRTRRSLEHYFPRANANGLNGAPGADQINCLGNYAMIGSEANSSGSNWSPKAKLTHYLDSSGKIKQISVASLKFRIMMQKCKDNESLGRGDGLEWNYDDIKEHQAKIINLLSSQPIVTQSKKEYLIISN